VQTGAALPSWAAGAAATTATVGVGALAPAVLAVVATVGAVAVGVAVEWRPQRTEKTSAAERQVASVERPSTTQPPAEAPETDLQLNPAPEPRVPAPLVVRPPSPGNEPTAISIAPRAAKATTNDRADLVPEGQPPAPLPPSRLADAPPRGPDDAKEIQDVATAERLLSSAPAQALALARAGEASYPSGYLREERLYVVVTALFKLGRLDEARASAARFLSEHPDGPFSARVRAALTMAGGDGGG